MESSFDEFMFMAIKQSASMEDVIENFFSFLRRHTDFCHTMLSPEELRRLNLDGSVNTRGFQPFQMVELVNKVMQKNFMEYRKVKQPYLMDAYPTNTTQGSAAAKAQSATKGTTAVKPESTTKVSEVKNEPATVSSTSEPLKNLPGDQRLECSGGTTAATTAISATTSSSSRSKESAKDKCGPVDAKYTINPWNGAITKKYAWTQTLKELTLEILAPERVNSKNVSVLMNKTTLTVKILDKVLVDGELCRQINHYDSVWNIEDGYRILISIEKSEEYWWDCVIKGDETIDTQQIESVKRLDEFTGSEQSAILKMMSDHRKKNNM
ncbi:uncharacterized protein TOT_030000521 [Theileria orientalis strain Shintoku]|uniref:Nuclear migration protein nudC n=1 Tax=Theileria orientalis strain Shintoku TaxID=869250 RepID=J4C8R7_THEOR|nr:uncharacterized protein TOT_030000521 [Theileria orientalis strain Shintoku]BAM41258.1 uncharacterized protein TOT_030000521 [Theileria orientalis strain Shintoku]|eukprot:XP_009691559.1 uncharacterized protein TOT_030000521 [Theileria orientalis strain Shintoku]